MTGTVTPAAPSSLTNADRCDRCGAQARVRVVLSTGDLIFCAHHGKAYEAALKDKALEWVDETGALQAPV